MLSMLYGILWQLYFEKIIKVCKGITLDTMLCSGFGADYMIHFHIQDYMRIYHKIRAWYLLHYIFKWVFP